MDQSKDKVIYRKALTFVNEGRWHEAHELIDGYPGLGAAHIHAYLHRVEGDTWNADYWYRRAGEKRPNQSLDAEWKLLFERYAE